MNLNPVGWASPSLRIVARLLNSGVNSAVPVTAISEAPTGAVNMDLALIAEGTGATLAQVPDGTVAGGDKRGNRSTDWQKIRTAANQVASGPSSVIGGGENNIASGARSTVGGGISNRASGGFATIGGGTSNTASSSVDVVSGGNSNSASGGVSFVGGGFANSAAGSSAVVVGGTFNTASGSYSAIMGGYFGTTRNIAGYHVFPACDRPIASAYGVSQAALLVLGRQTTDDTATVLRSDANAAGTTNQVILPNNSAYSFSGEVIAGVTGGGDTARWTINGAIKRGANAASTAMVGTATVTMTHNDAGAAAWVVAVTADTTNGGIAVTVTGAAATTIRWVCRISTVEMTY